MKKSNHLNRILHQVHQHGKQSLQDNANVLKHEARVHWEYCQGLYALNQQHLPAPQHAHQLALLQAQKEAALAQLSPRGPMALEEQHALFQLLREQSLDLQWIPENQIS